MPADAGGYTSYHRVAPRRAHPAAKFAAPFAGTVAKLRIFATRWVTP